MSGRQAHGASAVTIRPLGAGDHAAAEMLGVAHIAGTPWAEIVLPVMRTALGGGTREARGLGAHAGSALEGLAVFGEVAGTSGTARLHLVLVSPGARRRGVGKALVDAAAAELERAGGRLLTAELADDPSLVAAGAFLRSCGFEEEARVPDFYRDGVALVFLRRLLRD